MEQETIQSRTNATRATRAQLDTMRVTQDRAQMQRKRDDYTRQPRQEVTTLVDYVGTENGRGVMDPGMAFFYKAREAISPKMYEAFPHAEVLIGKGESF